MLASASAAVTLPLKSKRPKRAPTHTYKHIHSFGRLDLAVLNAGIGERGDFLAAAASDPEFEKTLSVDLTAAIWGVRLAAQCMIGGGGGSGGGVSSDSSGGGVGRGGVIIALASAAGECHGLLHAAARSTRPWPADCMRSHAPGRRMLRPASQDSHTQAHVCTCKL